MTSDARATQVAEMAKQAAQEQLNEEVRAKTLEEVEAQNQAELAQMKADAEARKTAKKQYVEMQRKKLRADEVNHFSMLNDETKKAAYCFSFSNCF